MEVGDYSVAFSDDDDIPFAHEVRPIVVNHQPSCIRRGAPRCAVLGPKNHRREACFSGRWWHIPRRCVVLIARRGRRP